jgi:hypothetical protein
MGRRRFECSQSCANGSALRWMDAAAPLDGQTVAEGQETGFIAAGRRRFECSQSCANWSALRWMEAAAPLDGQTVAEGQETGIHRCCSDS